MFLGYNTNGLAHHDLFDAVELLAEIGYRGVAITIDHNALSPRNRDVKQHIARLRKLLRRLDMRSVIETGARYLLNPRVKHEPTLLSEDRRQRIDFYKYAVDCAAELGGDCVSLWSGVLHQPLGASLDNLPSPFGRGAGGEGGFTKHSPHPSPLPKGEGTIAEQPLAASQALDRLVEGLAEVLDHAAKRKVLIAFEPEPGMLIDTMIAFEQLLRRIDAPNLRLTLDIGHLQCQGETPIDAVIRHWAPRLINVHIEDMQAGVHEHLMFGEGEIDFPPVLQALAKIGYTGGLYVELSRHSHEGIEAARKAFQILTRMTNHINPSTF